jgi:hypothetical protein
MIYIRFPLSLRNVEDLLQERGIDICHETVRFWWHRFGPMFAAEIRKRRVVGLRSTLTDVLARIAWAEGSVEVERLTPEQPSLTLKGAQTVWEVARTYFMLGVEHILGGIDHLLFVLALMLLIRDPWMLFVRHQHS